MTTARENVRHGLLVDSLHGPSDLNAVDWHVRQHNPSASPSDVQTETLDIIRSLVTDGLFALGGMHGEREHAPDRFDAWHRSLEHSIHHITHTYVKHYDDPERWMYSAWLRLTDKGEELARSIEESDIDGYRQRR